MAASLKAVGRVWPSWQTLLLLFLALLICNLLLFPARAERLEALSGGAGPVLDARFGYAPAEVHAYAGALGADGRRLYAITQVTLDFAYPAIYGLLLSGLLALVWRHGLPGRRRIFLLALLPFGMAIFDVAENLAIVGLMLLYPATPVWLAHLASAFTVDKWLVGALVGVALLAGLAAWGARRVRRDR